MQTRMRGISAIIAGAIVFAVLFMVFYAYSALMQHQLSTMQAAMRSFSAQREYYSSISGSYVVDGNTLTVSLRNNGLRTVGIAKLYVDANVAGTRIRTLVPPENSTSTWLISGVTVLGNVTDGILVLGPGKTATISIEFQEQPVVNGLALVTSDGFVLSLREITRTQEQNLTSAIAIASSSNLGDLIINSLFNLSNPNLTIVNRDQVLAPGSPDDPGSGVASAGDGVWCLYGEIDNATLSGTAYYEVLISGYYPGTTDKYDMMFTVFSGSSEGDLVIENDSVKVKLSDLESQYPLVKVVAYKYSGYISNTYYYSDASGNCNQVTKTIGEFYFGNLESCGASKITLNGTAERVFIYVRASSCGGSDETSYMPFLLVADTDGNTYPEIIFNTVDFEFGDQNKAGDDRYLARWGWYYYSLDADDVSTQPFIMVIKTIPLDSSKYDAVIVSFRFFFFDDAGGDQEELDTNSWIFKIGLYDPETGQLYGAQEFKYQQLMGLEDTYPPSTAFDVRTVTLLLPKTGKTYYVAVEFQDPYGNPGNGYNDADITIGVEYVTIMPVVKPP